MTQLVLASASPARASILRSAGIDFKIVRANLDEDAIKRDAQTEGALVGDVAGMLAERKAVQVSSSRTADLVIGADQVLDLNGALLSKALTLADACNQLKALRGREHALVSAVALAKGGAVIWRHVDQTRLRMRDFSDAFLDEYLAHEGKAVLDCVGCYRLEGLGAQLFEEINGDYFSILGLPLIPLLAALRVQGAVSR